MGKTEMWYVVDADKGAKLRSGFSEEITPKEYKERVLNNTITDVLQEYEIHPGDVFFLPAGRVHSIGAGAFIAEIRSEEHTSELQSRQYLVCRLLLEKKNIFKHRHYHALVPTTVF